MNITLTGGGTKPNNAQTYFFANFEGGAVAGSTWGVVQTMGSQVNVSIKSENCLEGTGCVGNTGSMVTTRNTTAGVEHTDVGAGGKFFWSADWYMNGTQPNSTQNWKTYRGYPSYNGGYNNYYGGQNTDGSFVNATEDQYTVTGTDRKYVVIRPTVGSHKQVELAFKLNSSAASNATDGIRNAWVDGTQVLNWTTWRSNTSNWAGNRYRVVYPVHWVWTGAGGFNADNNFTADNIIVETSWCAVYLTAASNGTGTKYWLPVLANGWTDTAITVAMAQKLTSGTYYLWVRDNNFVTNSTGKAVVFNGTTTPPSNVAPVVNAGSDITNYTTNTYTLDGTVTDDGLVNAIPSTAWAVYSGPTGSTFGSAGSVDTNITFSTSGVYVVSLSAHDGSLTTVDYATMTVLATATGDTDSNPTTPPVVVASTVNISRTATVSGGLTTPSLGLAMGIARRNYTPTVETSTSPNSISGMVCWYKADSVTNTLNGAGITALSDSSGNGHNLTGSATYYTNMLNGLPAIYISTASGHILSTTMSDKRLRTILWVLRVPVTGYPLEDVYRYINDQRYSNGVSGIQAFIVPYASDGTLKLHSLNANGGVPSSGSLFASTDSAHLYTVSPKEGSVSEAFVRVDIGENMYGGGVNDFGTYYFGFPTTDRVLAIKGVSEYLYEYVAYNRELTTTELSLVENYLYNKWRWDLVPVVSTTATTVPYSFNVVSVASTAATYTWGGIGAGATYTVNASTASNYTGTLFSSATASGTSTATISGLTASTAYYARIKATANTIDSSWSSSVSTTTNAPPAAASCVASSDTFTEASTGDLNLASHTPDLGTWIDPNPAGRLLIDRLNDVVKSSAALTQYAVFADAIAGSSVTIYANGATNNTSSHRFGVVGLYASNGDFTGYESRIDQAGKLDLRKSGVQVSSTTVATVLGGFTSTTYYDLKMVISNIGEANQLIRIFVNDVEATVLRTTDNTYTTGYGGMYISNTGPRITTVGMICP